MSGQDIPPEPGRLARYPYLILVATINKPATSEVASAATATTPQTMMMAATRRGDRGLREYRRMDRAVKIHRYAVHSVTIAGKVNNSSGLGFNAATTDAATTTYPNVRST
jgi:hypothetical protein